MSTNASSQPVLSETDIDFVRELAQEAGELAVSMREGVAIKEKTGPHDRVTEADFALSRLITQKLRQQFPKDVIVSEEDPEHAFSTSERVWLVDPIDGTDNYITNDGQYSVMIGLVVEGRARFGWVYAPARKRTYFGGPSYGAFEVRHDGEPKRIKIVDPLGADGHTRLMMGYRDRKTHPWVLEIAQIKFVKSGSVGLKVAKILDDEADMFIHLSGKLKVWDTAAPAAIAQAAGLEVSRLEEEGLPFELSGIQHNSSVIIGRPGSLAWCRKHLLKPQ